MNVTNISIFLYVIFIGSQVTTNSIRDDKCNNDSATLANVTSFYQFSSLLSRRYRRQISNTNQNCEIPNYPPTSIYNIISEPGTIYKPGDYVKPYSILELTCDKGYKLPPFTPNTSNCLSGQWNNPPSACLSTCPSLMSTASITVKCMYNGSLMLDNCIHPVDGTTVRLSCNTFYEADIIRRNPIRSCRGGKWTPNLPECYAICGLKSLRLQFNIINATNALPGDYPWQVGIYRNTKEFICGGSIIAQNIILSAAHCFTDYSGNVYPPENYLIAAGKYYRQYDDDRDKFAQYSTVRRIFVPERYRSVGGLNGFDIAVVILEDYFTLTENLQPVCIELSEEYENTNYLLNNGTVTGWGLTQPGGNPSDELQELTIPYVPYKKCYDEVPANFRTFLMFDKICGGYLNQGISVCQGDSGGALVYNINDHYYVKGVVSVSPASHTSGVPQCNSQQYGLYTSVYHHIEFVRNHVTNYGWKESLECPQGDCTNGEINNRDSCRLPNFPQNGNYSLPVKTIKYEPGNYIPKYSLIFLNCDIGYEADVQHLFCTDKGKWIPAVGICTRTCSSLTSSKSTKIKCKLNGEYLSTCLNPVQNTIAEISCEPFYEERGLQQNRTRLCKDGSWDYPILHCVPVCGKKRLKGVADIVNGTEFIQSDYPWHVAVYNEKKELICGGSIIKHGIVLSAAHCFTSPFDGGILPKENYIIAAGKYYGNYTDERDLNAQYSDVHAIHVPEKYRGFTNHFESDISLIILSTPFQLSANVQPVCINLQTEDVQSYLSTNGIVTGWYWLDGSSGQSELLKDVAVPYVPYDKCLEAVSGYFRNYLSQKKICGGYLNRSDLSACQTGTGGTLVFPKMNDYELRYYARGITSLFPVLATRWQCDENRYGLYTSIADHIHFIKDIFALNVVPEL